MYGMSCDECYPMHPEIPVLCAIAHSRDLGCRDQPVRDLPWIMKHVRMIAKIEVNLPKCLDIYVNAPKPFEWVRPVSCPRLQSSAATPRACMGRVLYRSSLRRCKRQKFTTLVVFCDILWERTRCQLNKRVAPHLLTEKDAVFIVTGLQIAGQLNANNKLKSWRDNIRLVKSGKFHRSRYPNSVEQSTRSPKGSLVTTRGINLVPFLTPRGGHPDPMNIERQKWKVTFKWPWTQGS